MNSVTTVRRLIEVYFFLLLIEGALRFWVLPGLSGPLLLVRDPLVVLIYLIAFPSGLVARHWTLATAVLLALFAGVSSLALSDAPVLVTLYGLRANFLHLPLIFVMQRVLTGDDVLRIGRWCMWIMVPMAILVVQQFRSPVGAAINLGGMPTHYGTVRPSGTFSFVSGMVCFSSLTAAFLANAFVARQRHGWLMRLACSAAVLASLAVSGSRSSIFAVAIVFVMLIGLGLFQSRALMGSMALLGVVGLVAAGLSSTEFYEEGQRQLQQRFDDASQGDSVMASSWDRFVDMFNHPLWQMQSAPLLGHGQGTGTNAGYFLMTGKRGFGGGQETELGRVIYEMGALFGSLFIGLRLVLTLKMFRQGWHSLKQENLLPLLLFGATGMNMVMGQWGVATTQGFATFGAGLCLASIKVGRPVTRRPRKSPRVSVWSPTRPAVTDANTPPLHPSPQAPLVLPQGSRAR
jgi:hypothetical protein